MAACGLSLQILQAPTTMVLQQSFRFHNTGSSLQILQEVAATMVPLQEPQSCCSPPPASTSPTSTSPTSPAFSAKFCFYTPDIFTSTSLHTIN